MEQVRRWHMVDRGWDDIGYHFIVDGNPKLHYGRKVWIQGAHDLGQNQDTLGILVMGNNRDPAERWLLRQVLELTQLMRTLRTTYGPSFTFEMHRENEPGVATECPGLTDLEWFQILDVVRQS